jgi:hypothetical protein
MNKALPPGMISLDEAVELIARHEHPKLTIIYRDAAFSAWDKLCKIAPIAARILTGDGLLRKPGAAPITTPVLCSSKARSTRP